MNPPLTLGASATSSWRMEVSPRAESSSGVDLSPRTTLLTGSLISRRTRSRQDTERLVGAK